MRIRLTGKQPPAFHRGDPNTDGVTDLSDAVTLIEFLFLQLESLPCLESGDTDNSGALDITDVISILNFLFLAGAALLPPGPAPLECGVDPDPALSIGNLGCEEYGRCN